MNAAIPMDLLSAARNASDRAYAPYSKFSVGAAAQTADGTVYVGANMENASFGLTVCAEVGALQQASTSGRLSSIIRVAVVGGPMDSPQVIKPLIVTPCGRCRQLIAESASLSGCDIEVWCASRNLEEIKKFSISELLPYSFGPGLHLQQ